VPESSRSFGGEVRGGDGGGEPTPSGHRTSWRTASGPGTTTTQPLGRPSCTPIVSRRRTGIPRRPVEAKSGAHATMAHERRLQRVPGTRSGPLRASVPTTMIVVLPSDTRAATAVALGLRWTIRQLSRGSEPPHCSRASQRQWTLRDARTPTRRCAATPAECPWVGVAVIPPLRCRLGLWKRPVSASTSAPSRRPTGAIRDVAGPRAGRRPAGAAETSWGSATGVDRRRDAGHKSGPTGRRSSGCQ
jgi:hypothetical protein